MCGFREGWANGRRTFRVCLNGKEEECEPNLKDEHVGFSVPLRMLPLNCVIVRVRGRSVNGRGKSYAFARVTGGRELL